MYGYLTDGYAQYDVAEISAQLICDVGRSSQSNNKEAEEAVSRIAFQFGSSLMGIR